MSDKRKWPEYLEPLRPDEMARHRMRRAIADAAESLLESRPLSWFEVTAGWSGILAPLAAALLIAFGALAYRASVPAEELAVEPAPEPVELVESLAPDVEAPPALLIDGSEPSRDALLAAALVTP